MPSAGWKASTIAETMSLEWERAGIPPNHSFEQLLCNPPTGILVAQFCSMRTNVHKRLFWRHKDSTLYQAIGNPAENVTQESVVVSLGKPILLFQTIALTEREDGTFGGNPAGIYLFDLEKLAVEEFLMPEEVWWPAPCRNGWVADLQSISEDGATVLLTVGLQGPAPSGYFLAWMDMATKQIELVSHLENTFF